MVQQLEEHGRMKEWSMKAWNVVQAVWIRHRKHQRIAHCGQMAIRVVHGRIDQVILRNVIHVRVATVHSMSASSNTIGTGVTGKVAFFPFRTTAGAVLYAPIGFRTIRLGASATPIKLVDFSHSLCQLSGRNVLLPVRQTGKQFLGRTASRPLTRAHLQYGADIVLIRLVNTATTFVAFAQQLNRWLVTLLCRPYQPVDALRVVVCRIRFRVFL
uniref:Uncharacterized protein n=1 Tax=Anopheles albimanus TaxID=7167 RepID=A0A182FXH0_ANOAL